MNWAEVLHVQYAARQQLQIVEAIDWAREDEQKSIVSALIDLSYKIKRDRVGFTELDVLL